MKNYRSTIVLYAAICATIAATFITISAISDKMSFFTSDRSEDIKIQDKLNQFMLVKNDTQSGDIINQYNESIPVDKLTTSLDTGSQSITKIFQQKISSILFNPRHSYLDKHRIFTVEERRKCLDIFQNGIYRTGNYNITELLAELTMMRKLSGVFEISDNQKYDHYDELKMSTKFEATSKSEQVDDKLQAQCLSQLDRYVERTRQVVRPEGDMVDHNMLLLLDTLGQPSAGLWGAMLIWTGDYNSCLELKIRDPINKVPESETRYCWAGLRPKGAGPDELIMTGLCLPKSCDSLNYGPKYDLLMELVRLRIPILQRNPIHVTFDRLYCLPDEGSPIRKIQNSTETVIFISMVSIWVIFALYCTFRDEGLESTSKLVANFSLKRNLRSLFKVDDKKSKQDEDKLNFSCVEGIKVICSSYIMMGHVIMCLTLIVKEGRAFSRHHPVYIISNQMPAFAVNVFFCITGLLTSYTIFKQHKITPFITRPSKWFALIAFRYWRIMPVYLLVVGYAKLVAKYTGSGPYWDYATSDKSMRKVCEQESWLATLMFVANFKHPFDHCIPSAWYLANDFQFFLITPILIYLLFKKPILGQKVLLYGTIGSLVAGFFSIYLASPEHDLTPIAKFLTHAFKTYVTFLTQNYTFPQYRISAYLIGLSLGYKLYEYEYDDKQSKSSSDENNNNGNVAGTRQDEEPWWARWAFKSSFMAVALFYLIPVIGANLPMNSWQSRIMLSTVMPLYHVIISLSFGMLIMAVATGKRRNLLTDVLSWQYWKPLARMSLTVVLINIEVIQRIIQTQNHSFYFNNDIMIMYSLYSIISVYILAIPFTIFFETPLRGLLNVLLDKAMTKQHPQALKDKKQRVN